MDIQIITSPTGERLVVLPEAEYRVLLDAAENSADAAAARAFEGRSAAEEEECLPAGMVERMVAGESPIRVWREYRGLSVRDLAGRAGISQPYLSQMEAGRRKGTADTLGRIAEALGIGVDDLI